MKLHVFQMSDLEAQNSASNLHNASGPNVEPGASISSSNRSDRSFRPARDSNDCESSDDDENEQVGLYNLAEELRSRDPPVEPWFMEMSRLRRIYIMWLNKRLSLCRKSILGRRRASDEDMKVLGEILHLQGKTTEPAMSQTVIDIS